MTEPNLDDSINEILDKFVDWVEYCFSADSNKPPKPEIYPQIQARKDIKALIANQVREARLDEIHAWFDMPKHYPGEEYLDEPFAKAKCKTPKKITYYTLDSSFTYSLKERLATLNGVKNK